MRSIRAKFFGLLSLLAVAGMAVAVADASRSSRTAVLPAPAFTPDQLSAHSSTDWLTSLGGLTGNRFSTLNQINTHNIGQVRIAWQAQRREARLLWWFRVMFGSAFICRNIHPINRRRKRLDSRNGKPSSTLP